MLDSDSDIEIISTPASASAESSSTSRCQLPTTGAAASDPSRPRPASIATGATGSGNAPSSSSYKLPQKQHKAGAWASTSSQANAAAGGGSSSASQLKPPLAKKKHYSDARKEDGYTSSKSETAGTAARAKGKGRASVTIVLSSDDDEEDEDDLQPLVVKKKKAPRASMPSLASTSSSSGSSGSAPKPPKASTSSRRHTLANPKVSTSSTRTRHGSEGDSSDLDLPLVFEKPAASAASVSKPASLSQPRPSSSSSSTTSAFRTPKVAQRGLPASSTRIEAAVTPAAGSSTFTVAPRMSTPSADVPASGIHTNSTAGGAGTSEGGQGTAAASTARKYAPGRKSTGGRPPSSAVSATATVGTGASPSKDARGAPAPSRPKEVSGSGSTADTTSSTARLVSGMGRKEGEMRMEVDDEPAAASLREERPAPSQPAATAVPTDTDARPLASSSKPTLEPSAPASTDSASVSSTAAGDSLPAAQSGKASTSSGSASEKSPARPATDRSPPAAAGPTVTAKAPLGSDDASRLQQQQQPATVDASSSSTSAPGPASAGQAPNEAAEASSPAPTKEASTASRPTSPTKPASRTGSSSGSRLPEAVKDRSPLRRSPSKGVSPVRDSAGAKPQTARRTALASVMALGYKKAAAPGVADSDSDSDIEFIDPPPKKVVSGSDAMASTDEATPQGESSPDGGADDAAPPFVAQEETSLKEDERLADEASVPFSKLGDTQAQEASTVVKLTKADTRARLDEEEEDKGEGDGGRAGQIDEVRDSEGEEDQLMDDDREMEQRDTEERMDISADDIAEPETSAPSHGPVKAPGTSELAARRSSPVAAEVSSEPSPASGATAPVPTVTRAASATPIVDSALAAQAPADKEPSDEAPVIARPTNGKISALERRCAQLESAVASLVRRDLDQVGSPTTSASSPSHTPGPSSNPSAPARLYGRRHKSTGGRPPVKKRIHRIRAIETDSDEEDADAVDESAQALETLDIDKDVHTSARAILGEDEAAAVLQEVIVEDSEMAEAADDESDASRSSSDDDGESSDSSVALQRALLPNRSDSATASASGPNTDPTSAPASASKLKSTAAEQGSKEQRKVLDEITLETTPDVDTATDASSPSVVRQPHFGTRNRRIVPDSDRDSSSSARRKGLGRKSTGQKPLQKDVQQSFPPVLPGSALDARPTARYASELQSLASTKPSSVEEILSTPGVADQTGRPLKRERMAAGELAHLSPGWAAMVKKMQEIKLPLVLVPADIEPDDPGVLEAQRDLLRKFKRNQKLESPWARHIAGPSYDFLDEFRTEIQDTVNRREAKWAKLHPGVLPIRSGYQVMFEQMILEAVSAEYGPDHATSRPQIRVCPPATLPPEAMSSPPFDFIYTNRVVYEDNILPVQAPGCGCEGDCDSPENRKTCTCLARQIEACTTKTSESRSNHRDFAWDRTGKLHSAVLDHHDQIIECNSQCGCGPSCINRVVGNRKGISVDIFWTGIAGWGSLRALSNVISHAKAEHLVTGVRLPLSYKSTPLRNGYTQRVVRAGEPLAVYAGELLRTSDAHERDARVYSLIDRNYIFDLDAWTVLEDMESLLPPGRNAKLPSQSLPKTGSLAAAPHKTTGSKGRGKSTRQKEKPSPKRAADRLAMKGESAGSEDGSSDSGDGSSEDEDDGMRALYSVDAFSLGNWTRFCNHVCSDWNATTRPVFIDEADVSRPLFVYFARRDIHPGEEITITYFGEEEPDRKAVGLTDSQWRKAADKARKKAPKPHRCYCGKKLCRGRLFKVNQKMFWDEEQPKHEP
ncbi:hypothetical protein JCM10908_002279 [Rhodotorula pacifica]|uniref:uncharacterized protein n=1 Tax=Rhodotorula pacifica TaxID=1495444 RepID=UPI0031775785